MLTDGCFVCKLKRNNTFVVVHPCHKYCLCPNIEYLLLLAVGANPPRDSVGGRLCSGAAAGGREASQGMYSVEINHITGKKNKTRLLLQPLADVTDCNRYMRPASRSSHNRLLQLLNFYNQFVQLSPAASCLSTSNQLLAEDPVHMLIFSLLTSMMPYLQSQRNIYSKLDGNVQT